MVKPVKRNKSRKFVSAKQRYWNQVYKYLKGRPEQQLHNLERGGKIVWEEYYCPFFERNMLAAYRKTDKYRCKPLMHQFSD